LEKTEIYLSRFGLFVARRCLDLEGDSESDPKRWSIQDEQFPPRGADGYRAAESFDKLNQIFQIFGHVQRVQGVRTTNIIGRRNLPWSLFIFRFFFYPSTNSIKMPQNVISKLFTIDSQLIDTHTRRLHLIRFESG